MTPERTSERPIVVRTAWPYFANSVLAALVGVVLARWIEQLGIAISGAAFGRDVVLDHVVADLGPGESELVLLGGHVALLLVAVVLVMLFPSAVDRGAGKLVMLWTALHSFRIVFVDMALLPIADDGTLSVSLSGINLPAGLDIVLAAAGVVGMVLVSIAAAAAFLGFARHRTEVASPSERVRFVASIALVPGIISPLLAVAFFVPAGDSGILATLPFVGMFTLVTLAAAPATHHFRPPQLVEERGLSIGLLIVVAVLFLFKLLLQPGVPIPPWDENLDFKFRA